VTIAEYLVRLSKEPKRLAAFQKDPAGALKRSSLTQKQRDVILSGDAQRIQHVIEFESDTTGVMIVCIHFTPGQH
jgi:hypothetical protein